MIVFDSSALLAQVRNERGADLVGELLEEADVPHLIHSANMCEVFHQIYRLATEAGLDGRTEADRAIYEFVALGIEERTDLDGPLWRDAGELIAQRRIAGASLPLGDALGVALARRLDAEFVTADRAEIEPLEKAGLVKVIFIR